MAAGMQAARDILVKDDDERIQRGAQFLIRLTQLR